MTGADDTDTRRRRLLRTLAAGGGAALAGCSLFGGGNGGTDPEASDTAGTGSDGTRSNPLDDDRARELAERFAPRLYFDAAERWFPTDPRPYRSDADGETVVEGFDALNGYVERARDREAPPAPTVFYHAVAYPGSSLAVVQFWLYSAFDQFTTNFHWHDWELLQVFVDTDTDAPQLFVASAHSRRIPNNEFLDPGGETVPVLLSELGSHSSGLSVNDDPRRFQRFPAGDSIADVTNAPLEGIERLAELPAAYGLPRDEGGRLPYLVPELDGAPVYEHERLPAVEREDLVPATLTVRSYDALTAPPTDLPARETGPVFEYAGRGTADEADVSYALVPTAELEGIADFTGPRLSFEFAVPGFAEDALADHITSVDPPWTQPRYDDPVTDITDPSHRAALAERYDPIGPPEGPGAIAAAVTEAVTAEGAPDGQGLTTRPAALEFVALVESEPTAVPTFRGAAVARDLPAGEHRLTVNGAGVAPHAERISVREGRPTPAGVDGEVPVVVREDAIKLRVDGEGTDASLDRLALEDDFAGRLYDALADGREAVYVHRGGAYTTEVRDADGAIGAFRVNPDPDASDGPTGPVTIERPDTGKASLSRFLATLFAETREQVETVGRERGRTNALRGLVTALEAVERAAKRAAERAAGGNRGGADESLERVASRIGTVAARLADSADALPAPIARAIDSRLDQAERRAEQASAAEKL